MHTWINNLKVIAWDLDGTLYPATEKMDLAIGEALLSAIAFKLEGSLEEADLYYQQRKRELKSTTKVLDELGINGQEFFMNLWLTLPLEQYIQPNPELVTLFSETKGLVHIMHTNSNTRATIQRKLDCIGLPLETFSHILTSGQMKAQKPDIKAFEILIDTAKVKPEEILYVGDRIEIELKPAQSLGIHTCFIGSDKKQDATIDLTFFLPIQVLKHIKNHNTNMNL